MRGNNYWEILKKAENILSDRNYTLAKISKTLSIPLPTIKNYARNLDKLSGVSFERVVKLAELYDEFHNQK